MTCQVNEYVEYHACLIALHHSLLVQANNFLATTIYIYIYIVLDQKIKVWNHWN